MNRKLLVILLLAAPATSQAGYWLGVSGGYQNSAQSADLGESSDKTGYYFDVNASAQLGKKVWNTALEPSVSFFYSSISGSTNCCGKGEIQTQSLLLEAPLRWDLGKISARLRPGVMVGQDLNFNITNPNDSKGSLFSIGADVFVNSRIGEYPVRYGARVTSLPSAPETLLAGAFIQIGFGSHPTENQVQPEPTPTPAAIEAPAPTPAPEKSLSEHSVEVSGEDVKVTLPKDRVRFAVSKAEIDTADKAFVKELGKALKKVSGEYDHVLVLGHSDKTGNATKNVTISKARAESVARLLREAGLDPKKVRVEGRGSKDLLKEGDTEEAHAWNRRVEIIAVKVQNKEVVVRELTEGVSK